jgi:hypothetical protein
MTLIHINAPKGKPFALTAYCPTCERDRRMFSLYYEWYGALTTCAGCGEQWSDGERLERPFCPGWRRRNAARAIKGLASIGVQA